MTRGADTSRKLNFEHVNVLVLDENSSGLDIIIQILSGFGVRNVHAYSDVEEARGCVESIQIDLFIIEQEIADDGGIEFIRWLRRLDHPTNSASPVIVAMGHTTRTDVMRMRDCGANYIVRKPLSPSSLMQRIIRSIDDPRPFVTCDVYAGPDRRFKYEGPPPGSDGRRSDDQHGDVSEQAGENLAQDDIDAMLKPRKVQI
ncbi:MAG: response regulator [Maricaulaceae bacterium]|jgi:DNA-binding response OmpR family regulator